MSETDETQEPTTTPETTEAEEPTPAAEVHETVAFAAAFKTEYVLESQRWVLRATTSDGSVHILHNEEEVAAFNAQYGESK